MRKRNREKARDEAFADLRPLLEEVEIHQEATYRACDEDRLMEDCRRKYRNGERGAYISYLYQEPFWNSLEDIERQDRFPKDAIEAVATYDGDCEYVFLFYPINGSVFSGYVLQEWFITDPITGIEGHGFNVVVRIEGDPLTGERIVRKRTLDELYRDLSDLKNRRKPVEIEDLPHNQVPTIFVSQRPIITHPVFLKFPFQRISPDSAEDLHNRITAIRSRIASSESE